MTYIQRGTPEFKKVNLALFAGGFCTFAILWGTQPLLPEIAREFHLSPALSSLSQTSTTIALAISLLIAGSFSDVFGRKTIMTASLVVSSILAILTGFVPNFGLLILFCAVLIVSHVLRNNIICYEISQVALCAVIVTVTMRVDISNKILEFFGKYLFEIYILMRIPMIILLKFNITNTYLFVIISFIITLLIAVLFKKFLNAADRVLLK